MNAHSIKIFFLCLQMETQAGELLGFFFISTCISWQFSMK